MARVVLAIGWVQTELGYVQWQRCNIIFLLDKYKNKIDMFLCGHSCITFVNDVEPRFGC